MRVIQTVLNCKQSRPTGYFPFKTLDVCVKLLVCISSCRTICRVVHNNCGAFSFTLCSKSKAARGKITQEGIMTSTNLPPGDSYAKRFPFSPKFVLTFRGFRQSTRGGRENSSIAIREKACAVFSNKYFANFQRSQRFAIGFEKILIF